LNVVGGGEEFFFFFEKLPARPGKCICTRFVRESNDGQTRRLRETISFDPREDLLVDFNDSRGPKTEKKKSRRFDRFRRDRRNGLVVTLLTFGPTRFLIVSVFLFFRPFDDIFDVFVDWYVYVCVGKG